MLFLYSYSARQVRVLLITKTSAYFPSYDQVPRGSAKVSLLEDGLYLDPTELDKSRGEVRL